MYTDILVMKIMLILVIVTKISLHGVVQSAVICTVRSDS